MGITTNVAGDHFEEIPAKTQNKMFNPISFFETSETTDLANEISDVEDCHEDDSCP